MVLIQILLPTTPSNLSQADATAAIATTRRELTERFGGSTAYLRAPAKGLWTAPSGEVEHDEVVMVEVVAERLDREWWTQYAGTLAARFAQQAVHIRSTPIDLLTG